MAAAALPNQQLWMFELLLLIELGLVHNKDYDHQMHKNDGQPMRDHLGAKCDTDAKSDKTIKTRYTVTMSYYKHMRQIVSKCARLQELGSAP